MVFFSTKKSYPQNLNFYVLWEQFFIIESHYYWLFAFWKFKNGKKKGVWEWTSYYLKNKDWKNNRQYADVKNDFEYIERSLNQEYTVQKQGDKQIKISISTNKEQKKDKKFQNANNQ